MYWIVHMWLRQLEEIALDEVRRLLMFTHQNSLSGLKSTAADIWNGLLQAVPNSKGTAVFVESTANGVTGIFYDLWRGACDGTNGFVPVFIPWFTDRRLQGACTLKLSSAHQTKRTLPERYNLDDEQLMFRRRKIAQNGIDLFKQEYPAEPDEAFFDHRSPCLQPRAAEGAS